MKWTLILAVVTAGVALAADPQLPQTTAEEREAVKDLMLQEQAAEARFLKEYQKWQIQIQQMIDANPDKHEVERLQQQIDSRKADLAKKCGQKGMLGSDLRCLPKMKEVTDAHPVPALSSHE